MKFPDEDEDQAATAEEKPDVRDLDVDVSRTNSMSEEKQEPTVVAGIGMSEGATAKLSTSAVTGMGLAALLETVDKWLAQVDKQSNEPSNHRDESYST